HGPLQLEVDLVAVEMDAELGVRVRQTQRSHEVCPAYADIGQRDLDVGAVRERDARSAVRRERLRQDLLLQPAAGFVRRDVEARAVINGGPGEVVACAG